ncbi:BlaI/MecI/CopY family transcriptional regulator [Planctomicrobium piriforme]|uniref:BlaI family transcriptional regulator, penicillinase repressor n=1 Tax=Planctomicrobium piriforme TaxID=1576369 RepID=A0A1I3ENP3_9PLAN|nr:BlaI/MecI/CopY family transcriptional regulator [Planctomicrobium piriforme]SFI00301.1 BlaI family transcriptional regulator, penicillinase repressor [Planctomicrobium piriforme]
MIDVQISDAEWRVMNVIWEGQPLTAQQVIAQFEQLSDWSPATIKTMLHRLTKKRVLAFEPQGNKYVYRARVRRSDCVRRASRSFLERVFDGESSSLLAHFMKSSQLTAAERDELRRILDEQEAQS